MKPSKEEAEKDLEMTQKDIQVLHQILNGLRQFQQTDQDRDFLRRDIPRYEGYLREGNLLADKITEYLKSL